MAEEKQSFWERESVERVTRFIGTKMIGPVIALVVIVVAFVLVTMGFKEIQIGGLLGKLIGKKPKPPDQGKTIEVINSVDKDRVDPKGQVINPGAPDSQGMTQAVVVPIKEPGLLSDPKKVVFNPPNGEKTVIVLPDGVTNRDVDNVVVIKPDVIAVQVKDSSGISAKRIDDLLNKYGNKP
jgi:hypothetical protein